MPTSDTYRPVVGWPHVPHGMTFNGDAAGVAVAPDGRVFIFNRGPTSVMVFNEDGRYQISWGAGEFQWPHAAVFDERGDLSLVDAGAHVVQKHSADGELLLTIGTPGQSAPAHSGDFFNRPTDVAVDATSGNVFVSDGYGNARAHVFDAAGSHLRSWGSSGADPGQFSVPHGITLTSESAVVVCDRENSRLQVFEQNGSFVEQWHLHRPAAVRARKGLLYVAELGPPSFQHGLPDLGSPVSILDVSGRLAGRLAP
jgi:DNA-binding beta-propeller fold protein YncE